MKNKLLILTFAVLLAYSCNKEEQILFNAEMPLIGFWTSPSYHESDSTWHFERVADFKSDDYGFKFDVGQKFIERKNSGWCGTPPIAYDNFEGNWTSNNSNLHIEVKYWGGNAVYDWEIVQVSQDKLIIRKLNETYDDIYNN